MDDKGLIVALESLSVFIVVIASDSLGVSSGNWKGKSENDRRAFSAANLKRKRYSTVLFNNRIIYPLVLLLFLFEPSRRILVHWLQQP